MRALQFLQAIQRLHIWMHILWHIPETVHYNFQCNDSVFNIPLFASWTYHWNNIVTLHPRKYALDIRSSELIPVHKQSSNFPDEKPKTRTNRNPVISMINLLLMISQASSFRENPASCSTRLASNWSRHNPWHESDFYYPARKKSQIQSRNHNYDKASDTLQNATLLW